MTIPTLLGDTFIGPSILDRPGLDVKEYDMKSNHKPPGVFYKIQVQGELDISWGTYFEDLAVSHTFTAYQPPITTLTCPVVDQPALRGLLCKLWDMNLTLISLHRIEEQSEKDEGNDQ
jgi:hypothetical protein